MEASWDVALPLSTTTEAFKYDQVRKDIVIFVSN